MVHQFLHSISDPAWISGADGRLEAFNKAFQTLFGNDGQVLPGSRYADIVPPETAEAWLDRDAAAVESGREVKTVSGLVLNGRFMELEVAATLLSEDGAAETSVFSVARVLNEKGSSDARDDVKRYKRMVENSYDLIVEFDSQGIFLYVNERHKEMTGHDPADLLGRSLFEFIHENDRDDVASEFRKHIQNPGQYGKILLRFRHADGSWMWLEATGRAYITSNGEVRLTSASRDMTPKIEAETALRESEGKYYTLFESSNDGILLLNPKEIADFNSRSREMFGVDYEQFFGADLIDFVSTQGTSPNEKDRVRDTITSAFNGESMFFETRFTTGSGEFFDAEVAMNRFELKQKYYLQVVIRDISRRKKIEEHLREAKEKAEAANKLKSEFLTLISHELKTPLTSIVGFSKMVKKRLEKKLAPLLSGGDAKAKDTSGRVMEYVGIIMAESRRLTEMIENIIELVDLQSGDFVLNMESTLPAELVDRAMAEAELFVGGKHLQLIRDVEPHLPRVRVDKNKMLKVLANLLDNAVKFTEKGSVTCSAYLDGVNVVIKVIDTGSGIPNEFHEAVFEIFRQPGYNLTEKPQGAGLGLAVCKKIIELHGGIVSVESEPGKGSSFTFSLPAEM